MMPVAEGLCGSSHQGPEGFLVSDRAGHRVLMLCEEIGGG